jgi:DNA helicase II / ATP-dependent DNA helicase PcrA
VDYLTELNPQQRRAVTYGIRPGNARKTGPFLVIAGAGTGKTKTIAHRATHLLANGIDPHRILLLTFTRRAAEGMKRRVRRVASKAEDGKARPAVVGHFSLNRRTAAARICAPNRPKALVHHS